jgi:hypothetical protein
MAEHCVKGSRALIGMGKNTNHKSQAGGLLCIHGYNMRRYAKPVLIIRQDSLIFNSESNDTLHPPFISGILLLTPCSIIRSPSPRNHAHDLNQVQRIISTFAAGSPA